MIANCRLNDAPTDSYRQNGYLLDDGMILDGSQAYFDYTDHTGIAAQGDHVEITGTFVRVAAGNEAVSVPAKRDVLTRYPEKVAAAVPVSAFYEITPDRAETIREIPIWVVGGDSDEIHHNATYKLARALQARGHRILYVETMPFLNESIIAQGFEVVRVETDGLPEPEPPPAPGEGWLRRAKAFYRNLAYIRQINRIILAGNLYDGLIAQTRPDLIILDTDFVCNAALLHQYGIPVAIIQTCVSLDKDPYIPVFTTTLPYGRTPLHYLVAEASWAAYFCKNFFAYVQNKYWFTGIDKRMRDYPLLKKIAAQTGFPLEGNLNRKRVLHVGFRHLPEFITSPREFDFPRPAHPNQYYTSTT